MFRLTDKEINSAALSASLKDIKSGALVIFEGWVRDHNEGKKVEALEYQVYPELAQKEGEKVLTEAKAKFNLKDIICIHRHGTLKLADCAVWIGATSHHRGDAFSATRYVIDEIKTRLPIWKKEHYEDGKNNWVSCQGHEHHVHFLESDYYQKQVKITNQELLKKARVLVVGAGGLGCPALQSLAMAGVGHIKIVDFDKIDITNLHRQPLFTTTEVGEKKSIVAPRKLMELNPFIEALGIDLRVDSKNVLEAIESFDLVLDCTDNLETKYLLHDACFFSRIPLISAGIYKYDGQVRTFVPGTKQGCLRCFKDNSTQTPDDTLIGNCNDFGVLGATASVLGSLQASEALQFLQTNSNSTLSETFYFNLLNLEPMKIKNQQQENCLCCLGKLSGFKETPSNPFEISLDQLPSKHDYELVDVRDKEDCVLENYKNSSKKIIIYCHRGIRSRHLVKSYRDQGYSHFYSLLGGACSL